ncbi:MAG: hypothetical protein R3C45_07735 [Phycisphaerales bacterium]
MPLTLEQLDAIMEKASRALADMDYLTCEALCLDALTEAKRADRYGYYARVLLPLQEARRQRRMIAAAGDIQLGSGQGFEPGAWLENRVAGCVALTSPHKASDALAIHQQARQNKQFVEVLFADNELEAAEWTLRSYDGPTVSCAIDAPPPDMDSSQWFIEATERLGDAALTGVDSKLTGKALVDELESRLRVFPDHELLHQRLADAAKAVRAGGS